MKDLLEYVEDNNLNINIFKRHSGRWEIVLENIYGKLNSSEYFLLSGKGNTISEAWKLCLEKLNSEILKG